MKEEKREFEVSIEDFYIIDEDGDNQPIKFADNNGTCETIEEVFDMFYKLKRSTYCKITSKLVFDKSLISFDVAVRGMLEDIETCSVCMDNVGRGEKLVCGHYCCRQCRHQMLRKKDRKCPLCRQKTVLFWNIECCEGYGSDEEIENDEEEA
jgi:hypothetical protein